MKLLLISDLHLGIKQNSEFFLNVSKDFFDNMVSPAIKEHNIEQLWFLGDYYDNRFNTGVLVENFGIDIITNLLHNHENLKVKMLLGNHDIFYKNTLSVNSMKGFEQMKNPRLEIIKDVKIYKVGSKSILAVPWLIHGSQNWTKYRKVITKHEETGKKICDYCFGHFEINGFEVVKGVVHESGLSQSDFKAFGETYSGHFHIRNRIGNIQYLGCPFELTWNDFGNPKGITIINTESGEVEFIENTKSPKHKHIKLSSVKEDESILDDVNNNLIKFHIDETIDESELTNIITKMNSKKPFNSQIIDERYEQEIENEDIEIDDLLESDALKYALEYTEQVDLPDELNLEDLKNRIIKLFNTAATEIE